MAARAQGSAADVAPAVPTCEVRLRVVDERGHGLAGAIIHHGPAYGRSLSSSERRTGPDGLWLAGVPRRDGRSWWRIEAQATGFHSGSLVIPFLPASALDLGTLRLDPLRQLSGRVVDRLGLPVSGAKVEAVAVRRSVSHSAVRSLSQTVLSDEGGWFAFGIESVPAGYDVRLVASQATLGGPFERDLGELSTWPSEPIVVTLGPSATIQGTVIDADGRPLAGVTVTPTASPQHVLAPALTDGLGRFVVPAAPGHKLRLVAQLPGYVPLDGEPATAQAPTENLVLAMVGSSRLSIVASEATTGRPLEAFDVSFCSLTKGFSRCHEGRGTQGVAELADLPPGIWSGLQISARGFDSVGIGPLVVSEFESVGPLAVQLTPIQKNGLVTGRVTSNSPAAIQGAVVQAYPAADPLGEPMASSVCDARGGYRLEGLPAGGCVLVASDDQGRTSAPLLGSTTSPGWSGADLLLREPALPFPSPIGQRLWSRPTRPWWTNEAGIDCRD